MSTSWIHANSRINYAHLHPPASHVCVSSFFHQPDGPWPALNLLQSGDTEGHSKNRPVATTQHQLGWKTKTDILSASTGEATKQEHPWGYEGATCFKVLQNPLACKISGTVKSQSAAPHHKAITAQAAFVFMEGACNTISRTHWALVWSFRTNT